MSENKKLSNIQIEVPEDSGSLGEHHVEGSTVFFMLHNDKESRAGHWFYFRVSNVNSCEPINFVIKNISNSLYPNGWCDYLPFFSADGFSWQRVSSSICKDGTFRFSINQPPTAFYVSWHQPYTISVYQKWIASLGSNSKVKIASPLENFFVLSLGCASDATVIFIARQHPGEVMASFFMEGIMKRLLSATLDIEKLLARVEFIIAPLMNPKGVLTGQHRFNKNGIDYNRMWENKECPKEIEYIKSIIGTLPKLHFFFDVHGDESTKKGLSYIFSQRTRKMTPHAQQAQKRILQLLARYLTDFESFKPHPMYLAKVLSLLKGKKNVASHFNQGTTATQYIRQNYKIPAFAYEINAHKNNAANCTMMGESFIQALADYFRGNPGTLPIFLDTLEKSR